MVLLTDSDVGFPPNGDGVLPIPPDENSELPILAVLKGSTLTALLAVASGRTGEVSFFGKAGLLEVLDLSCENGFGATADIGG